MNSELPSEYKNGYMKFLNCKINLTKKVFIPRIETEFWVKKAIKNVRMLKCSNVGMLKVLDIFAGSGCIGIAILKNLSELCRRVDFVDNDEKAIEQIKINLKLNKISPKRYKIYKSNSFDKLEYIEKCSRYDYIFANPPYVAKERLKEVEPSVLKYEPPKAILAGEKGLFYIRKFLKGAKRFLRQEGVIFLEFDPLQKEEVEKILKKDYNPPKDGASRYAGRPRVPTALPPFGRAPKYKNFQFFKDQFKKYRWIKISVDT